MKKLIILTGLLLCSSSLWAAGELIINEFNAVGSEKWLNGDTAPSTQEDGWLADPNLWEGRVTLKPGKTLTGSIQGNLGDWIELVVTQDHLDIRGWQIRWAETDKDEANEGSGTIIWYGDGYVEQGILTFSQNPLWSDLRAGTIITIGEEKTIYVDTDNGNKTYNVAPGLAEAIIDMSTDTGFDPMTNDWWIHVSTQDPNDQAGAALITSVHNVSNHQSWDWGCGNDDWQARVYNPATSTTVWGPVGEALGTGYWGGSGINSRETGRLEENPSAAVTGADFEDANTSYFSIANRWGTPENTQSFAALRAWYYQPADCAAAIAIGFKNPYDFNDDCYVNLADFAKFAENWLKCINPTDVNCSKPWLQ